MPATSCGILLWRRDADGVRVLLTHPGGPFWRNRDDGAWTIPKGAREDHETDEAAALREFAEELGMPLDAPLSPLGQITQRGGKRVHAFAAEGDFDVAALRSNHFECEWPPRSGRMQSYPEVDRAAWCTFEQARVKLLPAQCELLDRLEAALRAAPPGIAPRG
ncbi:NUDIX hydrolase [Lysobacter dokdonensis DS-58]|uniref:NUDIX hydrolase n=1 Tax=Lysobacter dokdonensis DS-58 TaxID=1300345 RepID=A0A0A2WP37_9GAMM|nr:NUDIX domain-containing protein [Lysobacter dokdonensis]KGQ20502.1 NUDIX hydrolase [Lysobacter dokdonensis DS-58]